MQFVDGDCEVVGDWLERASSRARRATRRGGRLRTARERYPEQTIYNRLADLEWDSPVGEAKACGGDALMRAGRGSRSRAATTLRSSRPRMMKYACESAARGWKILRIDAEMTLHDMAMTRFRQWWKRSVRTGHAYAEGSSMYGRTSERHFVRQTRSAIFWGIAAPILGLVLAWPTWGVSLLVLAGGYLFLYRRTRRYYLVQRGWPQADARLYAFWIVLAKFPHAAAWCGTGWVASWQAQPRHRLPRTPRQPQRSIVR